MDHPQLTKLMSGEKKSGSVLHETALSYVKEGKAKIMDTEIMTCRSGQRSKLESLREEVYPTEYCPPSFNTPPSRPLMKPDIRGVIAFETRDSGVDIIVEPVLSQNNQIIDLSFDMNVVFPGRLFSWMEHKDQWGDASVRMPFYERQSMQTSLILANGKFEFVNAFSPKSPPPVPAVMKKILLFVRADVVPLSR